MYNLTIESWMDAVVRKISASVDSIVGHIEDPDNIIDEEIVSSLTELGWLVISTLTPMNLRFEYEDRIRNQESKLDEKTIFITRFPSGQIPYDISKSAVSLRLTLKEFFPGLSYQVIQSLPPSYRPQVYKNQPAKSHRAHPFNELATTEFILREILGLDFRKTKTFENALSLFVDIAIHRFEIPTNLKSVLLSQTQDSNVIFLYNIIDHPAEVIGFLQSVWERYIEQKLSRNTLIAENDGEEIALSISQLDKSLELQTKFTGLIAKNLLQSPIVPEGAHLPDWMQLGIHYYYDKSVSLAESLDRLFDGLPDQQARFDAWSKFAFDWAKWINEFYGNEEDGSNTVPNLRDYLNRLDDEYFSWLEKHYSSLLTESYLPFPTSVYHIPHHLAYEFNPSESHPLALVIIDGMSMKDWLVIQNEWRAAKLSWSIESRGVLALVPTLTSVSRQALLSGKRPREFTQDWPQTSTEENNWRSFWTNKGYHPGSIVYLRGLGSQTRRENRPTLEPEIEETLQSPHISVAALIVNTIDDFVHSSFLGEREFNNRVHHWARKHRYLQALIARLLEQFDTVLITSDHGHVSGIGIGDLSASSIAEDRALRARVFKGKIFEQFADELPGIALWQNTGLPENHTVIIPERRGLFIKEGVSRISHGGASLEETIVPYIVIRRKQRIDDIEPTINGDIYAPHL